MSSFSQFGLAEPKDDVASDGLDGVNVRQENEAVLHSCNTVNRQQTAFRTCRKTETQTDRQTDRQTCLSSGDKDVQDKT